MRVPSVALKTSRNLDTMPVTRTNIVERSTVRMKAFLLAAGLGTRLKPLTLHTPKCLVPVLCRPLLHYWIDLFEQHGIDEVLINTHHLSREVEQHLRSIQSSVLFHPVHEEQLLGSAGTVVRNKSFIDRGESFFIIYADNLTDINLTALHEWHVNRHSPFTLALYHTQTPEACGIIELDDQSRVRSFIEKPEKPRSNLANTGIYLTDWRFLSHPLLENTKRPLDFGFDIFPHMSGHMMGVPIDAYLLDIGSHENLALAERTWPHGQTC
ncbi:nucleotidyltransferase family protein [bacterium]|nr:nucleotidyltransferase family protein [candidate division CSSED10-310 bacterium]